MIKDNTLKVAIVHEFLLKVGGAEKVLLLLHQMFPEAPIYTFLYDEAKTRGAFKDCKIVTSSLQKRPFLNKKPRLLLSSYPRTIEEFDFSEFDIVISNSNSFAHGVITKPKTLHLCYCHSPMRYAWDWYHEYLKENNASSGIKSLIIRRTLHNIRIWDKVSSERVDYWIANSKNVADRIKKYYRKESLVVYPGVDVEKIRSYELKESKSDQYIIVSRLEPYKKIELAIEAFNSSKKQLVIIGEGSYKDHLKGIAQNNIKFFGWRSDREVYQEICRSKALIFAGEEDFGITPVESMACGRPVIAFGKGGSLETIVSGKTGEFFDEESAESLQKAINKFELNQESYKEDNCRVQAEKFSTEVFVNNIEKALNKFKYEFNNEKN